MLLLLLSARSTTFAGDAQWQLNPGSGDWNTATNWTPATVPNGSADMATFDQSNTTSVSVSANIEVNGITFTSSASAYSFTFNSGVTLTVSGTGITNDSGATQTFFFVGTPAFPSRVVLQFSNSSTAGNANIETSDGVTAFSNSSTAGNANLSGNVSFLDSSTADNANIFARPASFTNFSGNSTAGNATIRASDESFITFSGSSTAGNASISSLGVIDFLDSTTGGTAQITISAPPTNPTAVGTLDISSHNAPGVTIGSLAGSGFVELGANNLTVGSGAFSGVIRDGGSLTKIGSGTLALSGANTYAGGTAVSAGTLLVNNTIGSGTGSGAVQVNAGTLGGTGTIAGAVTVGTGIGSGAFLSPGQSPGTLTIQSALALNSDATYKFELNSSTVTADKVVANGVTITGAHFSFTDLGTGTLTLGAGFVVIDNTAVTAISGTFSNLVDGSVFTANGNTFQVSYEGGNGNDLTLTVIQAVPEPPIWAMMGAGASMLMAFMRFRPRRSSVGDRS